MLQREHGCSCFHHEAGSCLGLSSLALLLLCTTSTQALSKPVADREIHLQLGPAAMPPGRLSSSRHKSLLQTSPRATDALPISSMTTLGTLIAGPHPCFACAEAARSLYAGPRHWTL